MEEQKIQLELEKHKLQQQMLQKQQEVSSIRLFGGEIINEIFFRNSKKKEQDNKEKKNK